MTDTPELAVLAGPVHVLRQADLAVLQQLLARAPRCLVLLGSADLPRSIRNPFTWQERAAVIRQALPPADGERVVVQPLRERFDEAHTAQDVQEAAAGLLGRTAGRVLLARVGQETGFPLPAGWQELPTESAPPLHDRLLASDTPAAELAGLAAQLPAAAHGLLADWVQGDDWVRLRREYQQIAREKQVWSAVPYPVTLVTVDAVVRCGGHVLLIRRGRPPGQGLRALPGGFLETTETVLRAAVRELVEETQIEVPQTEVEAALRGVRVFDHPRRSQRGRVITHAHFFDLGDRPLPRVLGSDDAAQAEWVPIAELPGMQAQFLDDHHLVLEHFLGTRTG